MRLSFCTAFCVAAAMLCHAGAVSQAAPALDVGITIRNHCGVALAGCPVRGGVPLARGVLRDGEGVVLRRGDGQDVPCRVRPTARWYDGSVKWLLVDTQVDLQAEEACQLRLVPGKARGAPRRAVAVKERPDAIVVETGAARFEFPRVGFGLPGAAWLDRDGDGRAETQVMARPGELVCEVEHQAPGAPAEENWLRDAAGGARESFAAGAGGEARAEIESSNDLHAVVKLSGWLVNRQGRKLIQYVIRAHAYAGRAELKLCPTIVYAGRAKEDFIRSMYLRFPRVADGVADWSLGGQTVHRGQLRSGDDGVSLVATGPEKFYHLVPYTQDKTVYYKVLEGGRETAAGREAAGWARVGDGQGTMQAAVRNFWQMHPKELGVRRDALTVYLWPEESRKVLDLRRRSDEVDNVFHYDLSLWEYGGEGVGVTHEVLLGFGPPEEDRAAELAARLNRPLLLECTPRYYAGTLAFGPFGVMDGRHYPRLEAMQAVGVEWMRHNQKAFHWDGMIDYGDTLFHGYESTSHYGYQAPKTWCSRGYVGWLNSESVLVRSLFVHYLRSGDYELFLTAAEMARHSMDVDVCHHCAAQPRYVGGGHRHDQQHWGNGVRGYGADTQGIMDLYLLTGDERALDVARERAMFHDNGLATEDEDRIGGLYRFWEISGEQHWRRRAAELLERELRVAPDARWRFTTAGHFRFVCGTSVSLQYYYCAASPEETAPLRAAVLESAGNLRTWEPTFLPLIVCALACQISDEAKYKELLAGLVSRLNLPRRFEAQDDYRSTLRRLPFEEMVQTARKWGQNNLYGELMHNIGPLPYVIGALEKAGLDEEALLARKFTSPPPSPFEEKLDPKKIQGRGPGKPGTANFGYSYILRQGAPDDRMERSRLMLLENGKPLKAHQAHAAIHREGLGRFSHWGAQGLLFSSSDNSDPRTNGREYKVVYPWRESK